MSDSRPLPNMLLLTVAIAIFTVVVPPSASAQNSDGFEISAEVGYDERLTPTGLIPVEVTVKADRLVQLELSAAFAAFGGQAIAGSTPLEVPAGEEKQVLIAVPVSARQVFDFDPTSLTIEVWARSSDGASQNVSASGIINERVVGVMPGVDLGGKILDDSATAQGSEGSARIRAVELSERMINAVAFGGLSGVASSPDDLSALSPEKADQLVAMVAGGGTLFFSGAPGELPDWFPEKWHPAQEPSGQTTVNAGHGRVVYIGAVPSSLGWDRFTDIRPVRDEFSGMAVGQGTDPGRLVLPAIAGLRGLPAYVVALLGFIYVVIAGPLLFVLLRGRRRPLVWVVLPAMALTCSVLAATGGLLMRPTVQSVNFSVIENYSGAATIRTDVLGVMSRSAGEKVIRMPAGYAGMPVPVDWSAEGAWVNFENSGGRSQLVMDLGIDDFRTSRIKGPASAEPAVQVELTGSRWSGSVSNSTGRDLEGVIVIAPDRTAAFLGDMAVGEKAVFDLEAGQLGMDPVDPVARAVARSVAGPDSDVTDVFRCSGKDQAASRTALLMSDYVPGGSQRGSALFTVMGWSDPIDPVAEMASTKAGDALIVNYVEVPEFREITYEPVPPATTWDPPTRYVFDVGDGPPVGSALYLVTPDLATPRYISGSGPNAGFPMSVPRAREAAVGGDVSSGEAFSSAYLLSTEEHNTLAEAGGDRFGGAMAVAQSTSAVVVEGVPGIDPEEELWPVSDLEEPRPPTDLSGEVSDSLVWRVPESAIENGRVIVEIPVRHAGTWAQPVEMFPRPEVSS